MRLALRDLARYQARSGAALAAASLAIGIAATIAVTAAAEQAHDHTLSGGNLPNNQLIVWLANPNHKAAGRGSEVVPAGGGYQTPPVPNPKVVASARSTADAIARALGSNTVVELDVAVDLKTPIPVGAPADASQATLVRPLTGRRRQAGLERRHDALRGDPGRAQPLPHRGRQNRLRAATSSAPDGT